MKIAIIADSSCGIKNIKDYDNLYLVPLMITTNNGEQIEDDEKLNADEFYKLNDVQFLKTSQSIPGNMMKKWDELLKEYDQIVCLLISKGLSGQYNTCKMLSQEEEYIGKVFVVDTNGVSIILKKQIEMTNELIKQGKNAQEIEESIENLNQSFEVYIIPKSLDQLVRGGRISKAAASLAKILKITPILKYDGTIDKQGKTRTFKKAVEEVVLLLKEHNPNSKYIDIAYSRTSEEVLNLVKEIMKSSSFEVRLWDEIPNTITCHTGRDTFAIGVWKEDNY